MTKGHSPAWDFNGLCTTCSRCTEVCPVKIDIPWLNTVIRERNNAEYGTGIRERVFARTDLMGKGLSALSPIANAAMRTTPARLSFERLGIDSSRKLPAYERDTFREWWRRRPAAQRTARDEPPTVRDEPATGRVALFVDCFINHNLPHVGRAAVEVLEHAGLEVVIAHNSCCGRGALSQGVLGKPRDWAVKNLAELGHLVDEGYDVLFIEPSCLSAVRDDYARLLESTHPDDDRLRRIQESSYDITEYLVMRARAGQLDVAPDALPETYVVHGHCHQKSLGIGSAPAELLRLIPGVIVQEVEALCCGMVGSFGYKKEYSRLSRAIGAQLFEQIKRHPGDVAACGISCRSQIEMGTGRRVVHPVEVMAKALRLPGQ